MAETVTTVDTSPDTEVLTPDEQDSLEVGEALIAEQENLLAGKYKDARELEKAYIELQGKLGEQKEEKGESTSNRGGWHSRYDLNEDEHFVKNYLTYLGTSLTKELGDIPLFSFVNMWLNLNRKGDYNVMHNHPDCHYSLVWFIKTPKNCGDLVLQNPTVYNDSKFLKTISENVAEKYLARQLYTFEPKEGNCFLFPAHLYHMVESSKSDEDRISLAANLMFLG